MSTASEARFLNSTSNRGQWGHWGQHGFYTSIRVPGMSPLENYRGQTGDGIGATFSRMSPVSPLSPLGD